MEYKHRYRIVRLQPTHAAYFLVVLLSALLFALLTFKADAGVAVFVSGTTSAEQELLQGAQEGGEALLVRKVRWSNFGGSIPEGSDVQKISLHLSWFAQNTVDEGVEITPVVQEPQTDVVSTTTPEVVPEEVLLPVVDTAVSEERPLHEVPELPKEESEILTPQEDPVDVSEEEPVARVSNEEVYALLNAQAVSEVSLLQEFLPDTVEIDTTVESSDFVHSDLPLFEEEPSVLGQLRVRYSVDGVQWQTIHSTNYTTVGEKEFDISTIGLDALSSFHVEVEYVTTAEDPEALSFDTVEVRVSYGDVPVLDTPVLDDVVSDQEPNFMISSVKSDVRSENIRAVVIEKGGLLEFWYWTTSSESPEGIWRRLAGGGSIDGTAPIAIKERTIFWLDANQQTLFGFSVDDESIFAVSYESPENKVFLLPFEGSRDESWQVFFDPERNVFEFSKVRNPSL